MEYKNLPPDAPRILLEVDQLIDSLDMTPEEIRDALVGVVAALESYRPGYIQAFLTTTLDNRWRRQLKDEAERD